MPMQKLQETDRFWTRRVSGHGDRGAGLLAAARELRESGRDLLLDRRPMAAPRSPTTRRTSPRATATRCGCANLQGIEDYARFTSEDSTVTESLLGATRQARRTSSPVERRTRYARRPATESVGVASITVSGVDLRLPAADTSAPIISRETARQIGRPDHQPPRHARESRRNAARDRSWRPARRGRWLDQHPR